MKNPYKYGLHGVLPYAILLRVQHVAFGHEPKSNQKMKVHELIRALSKCNPESDIGCILEDKDNYDPPILCGVKLGLHLSELSDIQFNIDEVDNAFEELTDGEPALVLLRGQTLIGSSGLADGVIE